MQMSVKVYEIQVGASRETRKIKRIKELDRDNWLS